MEIEIKKNMIDSSDVKNYKSTGIAVIENTCSYSDFFENYLTCNKPCIIKDVYNNWEAAKYWVKYNAPDFEYLKTKYGNSDVIIYDCNEKYYNSQKTSKTKFVKYAQYWIDFQSNTDLPLHYLKDWHLKNQYPEDNFYEVPIYFASDWLNEYFCECLSDDYRFVYMGPKGTWTPFHADVFTSYSWSVNICGQKRWLIFPPGEEIKLKDPLGNLPYDVTNTNECNCYELIQNPGEAVFVPSSWHHQVWNVKDTISINHNWVNGCNIKTMWYSLEANLNAVKKAIEDCRDMDNYIEHCQIMLEASYGMNFNQFYQFIKYITMKRLKLLSDNIPIYLFNIYLLGKRHCIFDLKCIYDVLKLLSEHRDLSELQQIKQDCVSPSDLLIQIETHLKCAL